MRTRIGLLVAAMYLAAFSSASAQMNFTQLTNAVPVTDVFDAGGSAFVDYDNDGYADLSVANFQGNNRLYRNERDGTFSTVTSGAVVNEGTNESWGVVWGDFDNDGFPDLFVANGGVSGKKNFLYRNNGAGSFIKLTNGPIVSVSGHFIGGAWADYDRDGFIDLFVANNSRSGSTSLLFHNNGDGTFAQTNTTISSRSDAISGAWADFNNDGWPDLFVANGWFADYRTNFLFANLGGGVFQRVEAPSFQSARFGSLSVAWGDYDNDGFPDVFVTNNAGSFDEDTLNPEPNELYHNNGDGSFTRVTAGAIVTDRSFSTAAAWGDYDNDGWLDLFVGNRTYDWAHPQPSFLYHNNGNGTFTRITAGLIAEFVGTSGGCAWGDYDNDGFLDLFASSPFISHGGRNALFHNTGNGNAWLKVKCIGAVSNRLSIGAKVRVQTTIGGRSFWQFREITSGDGIGSAAFIAHFGLGDATNAQTLRIEWPSGTIQEFHDVAARQFLTLIEPSHLLPASSNGIPQFTLQGGRNMAYDIQTSTNLTDWSLLTTLTITNLDGTALIVDTNAPVSDVRFYRAVLR